METHKIQIVKGTAIETNKLNNAHDSETSPHFSPLSSSETQPKSLGTNPGLHSAIWSRYFRFKVQ